MDAALLSSRSRLDEAALARLARVADRLLATPEGHRPGPWRSDRRAGPGQEFHDFVVHVPGGDARRVDWRASARSRELLERRFRDATTGEWCICLDRSASLGGDDSRLRRLSLQLAEAFLYLFLHREHGVGFVAFSEGVEVFHPPARGRGQFARVLRALARGHHAGRGSRLDACVPHVTRRQSVLVISDFLAADRMQRSLARLAGRASRVHAIQLLDPDPLAVGGGAHGMSGVAMTARLEDAETGETLQVSDLEQARRIAGRTLAAQRDALRGYCERNGIVYTSCQVTDRWQDVVLDHLARARRRDA